MWSLVNRGFKQLYRTGAVEVVRPDGCRARYGDGQGTPVVVRLHDPGFAWKFLRSPGLAVGEAYMDGRMTFDDGDIRAYLDVTLANLGLRAVVGSLQTVLHGLRVMTRRLAQHNPVRRSHRNVAHHYDLSDDLYDLFLDADRQYSCAYFQLPEDDIEAAQAQKKRHLAAKLLLSPGQSVLDIGSGWGGLGLYLARTAGVDVTGVTLSREQHRVSNRRAEAAGLGGRARFQVRDYREASGRFDRIVSVGMFEHVGINHYHEYFGKVRDLLAEDGVALLHTIGRAEGPGTTNPWIRKYIFPGGYSPALSEVVAHVERAGLYITDIEVLRLHYAETLRRWQLAFEANRDRVIALYDERFVRMWEFYLCASEMAFRHGGHVVFQVQMAKRQDAVPLTRDYIQAFEAAQPPAPVFAGPRSFQDAAPESGSSHAA